MSEPTRSANMLVDLVVGSPELLQMVKSDPGKVLRDLAAQITKDLPQPAFIADVITYRIIVVSLGLVAVGAIIGAIYLTAMSPNNAVKIPDALTALGSAAIGALAGLLAPSPARK